MADATTDRPTQVRRNKRAVPKPAPETNGSSVPTEPPAQEPEKRTIILALLQHGDGPASSISRLTVEQIRSALKDVDPADRENTTLDVWLESGGGDAHSAYKIGLIFRSVASFIRVVVPDYAKSAATLLSLVADEIYMAPGAELGPLDAQVNYEQEGMTISALDRARSIDDLTETAMDIALKGGGMVLQYTRLSRAEAIGAMLDFAAKFLEPVVTKIDPTMLHYSNSLLRVAKEYGTRLMDTRVDCPPGLSASIPGQLLEEYPTHGFVVSLDEAQRLGLPVQPIANYDYTSFVEALYRKAEGARVNFIDVIPVPTGNVEEDEDEEGEHNDDDSVNSDPKPEDGTGD